MSTLFLLGWAQVLPARAVVHADHRDPTTSFLEDVDEGHLTEWYAQSTR